MKTITFKADNPKDLDLLIELAERLGIGIVRRSGPEKKVKKKWKFMGSADLSGKLDHKNIRDLAYE